MCSAATSRRAQREGTALGGVAQGTTRREGCRRRAPLSERLRRVQFVEIMKRRKIAFIFRWGEGGGLRGTNWCIWLYAKDTPSLLVKTSNIIQNRCFSLHHYTNTDISTTKHKFLITNINIFLKIGQNPKAIGARPDERFSRKPTARRRLRGEAAGRPEGGGQPEDVLLREAAAEYPVMKKGERKP